MSAHMIQRFFILTSFILALITPYSVAALGTGLSFQSHKPDAPVTALQDLHGIEFDIGDHKGKVLLVNFWATWCPPCVEELPTMQSVWQHYPRDQFEVIAVNAGETREQITKFLGKFPTQIDFPISIDELSDTFKAWNVRALPSSFIVDKQGHIVYKAEGGRDFMSEDIRGLIQKLIDE